MQRVENEQYSKRCKLYDEKYEYESSDDEYEDEEEFEEEVHCQEQSLCCIGGCDNVITNRLRFSLRTHEEADFKQEYLEIGWNRICHYHYFADLYKYKKLVNGTTSKPLPKVGKKKSREIMDDENVAERLPIQSEVSQEL